MSGLLATLLAAAASAFAFVRERACRRGATTWYEREVAHLDTAAHRRYAIVFAALAGCGTLCATARISAWWLVTIVTVIIIVYGAAFVRGAEDDDPASNEL